LFNNIGLPPFNLISPTPTVFKLVSPRHNGHDDTSLEQREVMLDAVLRASFKWSPRAPWVVMSLLAHPPLWHHFVCIFTKHTFVHFCARVAVVDENVVN
jgi:hypothetical protein